MYDDKSSIPIAAGVVNRIPPVEGMKRVYLRKMGFNFDTWSSLHLSSTYHKLVRFNQRRTWARVSWICAVVLLLMTSAQSAHMCGLAGDLRIHHGKSAQADSVDSPHTFCAICASSHSPSFAVSLAAIPSIDSLTERPLQRSIVRRPSSPVFALYTRPPPAV
jgi:hypothetical protein